jgi:purine-binding chemotaxis protein CheW
MIPRDGTLESSIERVLSELRREYWRSIETAPPDEPTSEPLLVVLVGAHRFVLSAGQAREVTRVGEIVALPGAPDRLAGVTSVRGQVVPVLDLRRVIEDVPSALAPSARLVTLRTTPPVAVLVEAVSDLIDVSLSDLLGAAGTAPAPTAPPVRGTIVLAGGAAASLLDIGRLVELATGLL